MEFLLTLHRLIQCASFCIAPHYLREAMGAQRLISPKKRSTSSTTLQHLFDLDSRKNGFGKVADDWHGRLQVTDASEEEEVLSIISHCRFVFTDPSESPSGQDAKRLKLTQLVSYLKSSRKPLSDKILSPLMDMVSANLFRPLPPPSNISVIAPDLPDDEEFSSSPSPAWPHLHLIYTILLRIITTTDPETLSRHVTPSLLSGLLALFLSEDPRERETLKTAYHKIYSKLTSQRALMRKAMSETFLQHVFVSERHPGIGDLLEIWGSIVNGLTVPVKEEHRLFLMRVLMPLHRVRGMQGYFRQLAYCVSQFIQKEPVLGGVIVRGILRYWPLTNCQKEVLLIGELEDVAENVDPGQYRKLAPLICNQLTKCCKSPNSQVAERALYVWSNERIVKMASVSKKEVFPVIVAGLEQNLKSHWSKSVKELTQNVKSMLQERDPSLYSKCLGEVELRKSAAREEEFKRQKIWEQIQMAASAQTQNQNWLLHPQLNYVMYVSSV